MFSTSSQQPIEQTSAPISCKAIVFSCRLAGAALFGFVYVSHLSLYQEIHADHSDAEAPRTNETVDLFMFDPLSLEQNNKLYKLSASLDDLSPIFGNRRASISIPDVKTAETSAELFISHHIYLIRSSLMVLTADYNTRSVFRAPRGGSLLAPHTHPPYK